MATVKAGSGNSSWPTVLPALALHRVGLLALDIERMGFLVSLPESLQLTTGRERVVYLGEQASFL